MDFDPYREWLKIPADRRPPGPHDLLGLRPGETDRERIQEAAKQRYDLVRRYRLGEHAAEAQRLLNELGEATASLLAPKGAGASEKRAIEEMVVEWLGGTQQGGRGVGVAASAEAWDFQGAAPGDSWGPFPEPPELDPYLEWFDVPASRRPPDSYDLLGLPNGETDAKRIREAAVERSARLRQHLNGPHRDEAKRLIAEVAQATRELLGSQKARPGESGLLLIATVVATLGAGAVSVVVGGSIGAWLGVMTAYLIVGPFALRVACRRVLGRGAGLATSVRLAPSVALSLLMLAGSLAFLVQTLSWLEDADLRIILVLSQLALIGVLLFALGKTHQVVAGSLNANRREALRIFFRYYALSLGATALAAAAIAPLRFVVGD